MVSPVGKIICIFINLYSKLNLRKTLYLLYFQSIYTFAK
nr:MAG TPA_asm: hypothetical protein [Caudoviricetes sp.]